jgi:mgtE-like transporter
MAVYSLRRIIKETYTIVVMCGAISLIAGVVLNLQIEKIIMVPTILLMIPPINDIGGNIGCIIGARLASALHMGTVEPKLKKQRVLRMNVNATMLMSLLMFLITSAALFSGLSVFNIGPSPLRLTLSFMLAGIFLTPIVVLCSVGLAFISFIKGWDPDNVVSPLITSIADVLGVICLLIAIKIIGV